MSRAYKFAVTTAAVALTAATGLTGAGPTAAAQVWNQSVGLPERLSSCPTSTANDTAAGWTGWNRSWAQWMNNGAGGEVCNRSVVWAYGPTAAPQPVLSGPCAFVSQIASYVDMAGGVYLETGSPKFADSSCQNRNGITPAAYVYGPTTSQEADSLCSTYGRPGGGSVPTNQQETLWQCEAV